VGSRAARESAAACHKAPLFRSRLDQMINLRQELARLAGLIDWEFFDQQFEPLHAEGGRPGVPTRLMVALHPLKRIHNRSDEGVCERWIENPYFQFFSGETFFNTPCRWIGPR
jgi:transposase, IS5 family